MHYFVYLNIIGIETYKLSSDGADVVADATVLGVDMCSVLGEDADLHRVDSFGTSAVGLTCEVEPAAQDGEELEPGDSKVAGMVVGSSSDSDGNLELCCN